jgi:hyaluronan synthase
VKRQTRYLLVALAMVAGLAAFGHYHLTEVMQAPTTLVWINILGFTWLALSLVLSHLHGDYRAQRKDKDYLADLRVSVVVPVYNEDPHTFRQMLDSLSAQSRPVQMLHVVDDGSRTDACKLAFEQWQIDTNASLLAKYTVIENSKKRHAQSVAFEADPTADVWVTIDSDTVLDQHAIRQGLLPFQDRKVMSVAGLLLSLNSAKNLLTRLVDLGFTMSFLNGRAAWSRVGSVVVNCGGLAFYRGEVVRKYLPQYLSQTVWGRKVSSGDDRMMTCFALQEGRTVLQESSVGYTLVPEKLSHLTRQRVRWWRSFFWGGGWLIQNFSLKQPAWWMVLWQFASFILFSFALPVMLVVNPVQTGHFPWEFLVYAAVLAYARSVRFLVIDRPDMSRLSQLATFALAPLSSLLHMYLCSVLQYAGLATFLKTGWGTREQVEVGLATGLKRLATQTDEGYCTLDDLLTAARPETRSY